MVFDIPMFWSLALLIDFKGAKNIHVLQVLIWGFGGHWRFMTGVWHPDIDLDMVTGLWYTRDLSFGSLSWFWRRKQHAAGSWLWFDILIFIWISSLVYDILMFWILAPNPDLRGQRTPCPLSPDLGLWRMLEVPDPGLASWSWFGYGHWSSI